MYLLRSMHDDLAPELVDRITVGEGALSSLACLPIYNNTCQSTITSNIQS